MTLLMVSLMPVSGASTNIFNWYFDTQENVDDFKAKQSTQGTASETSVTFDQAEQAMKVELVTDGKQGRIWSPEVNWESGKTYTIAFKAKGEGVTLGFYSDSGQNFHRMQNGSELIGDISLSYTLTSDWKTYSMTFTMLEDYSSTDLFFYFPSKTVGSVYWLDDFSLAEVEYLYDSLDLSGTEKTILAPGETTQISVKGIKGETVTELTEGVAFSSSNPQVASVDENGLVTAGREGIAVITATADEVSKSVTIAVGQVQKTIGYENSTDWTDTETEKVVADQVRSGAKALWMNTLNSTTALSSAVALSKGGGMKEITTLSQGAVQLWFYDDLQTGKNVFFQVTGVRNETTNKRMNSYIGINTTTNTYAEVGGESFSADMVKSTVPRSLGWHQLVVSWDSEAILITIDSQNVVSGTKPVDTPVASISLYKKASCPEGSIWVDDLISVNTVLSPYAPEVDSLTVDGACMVGEELTANESISDANGDPLDTSLYQWESSPDQTVWTEIEGATQKTYTPVEGDLGKYLRVGVTPRSTVEPKLGTKVYAQTDSKISTIKNPPSAADVSITGTAEVGSILTAEYTYVPSQGGDDEGESLFVWETAADQAGPFTQVQSSASKTYEVTMEDTGKYIRVKVIPKDINGLAGTEMSSQTVQIVQVVAYYVAANGSDSNYGSIEAPFATLEKARDTIRTRRENNAIPDGGITVYVREGTYQLSRTFTLTEKDSGTEDKPVTYTAYPGEKVILSGGATMELSQFKAVEGEMKDKLSSETAQQKVVVGKLSDFGLATPAKYKLSTASYNAPLILYDGQAMRLARYPNSDTKTDWMQCDILNRGKCTRYPEDHYRQGTGLMKFQYYEEDEARMEGWSVNVEDIIYNGYWGETWINEVIYGTMNKEENTIEATAAMTYGGAGFMEDGKTPISGIGAPYGINYYAMNVYEEMDEPGEYYIDRQTGLLYLYPSTDNPDAEIKMANLNNDLISVSDASYITLSGMECTSGRQYG
ncbi:MAG: Ig-like domain-containing protein, partial [Clostridia bacterium]|nr:Ig-like domain-containing protein [Clostridia bacterium]